jgi:hypothetical protein
MFHITFEMNIQLANALSEVSGVTGLAIIGQPIVLDRDLSFPITSSPLRIGIRRTCAVSVSVLVLHVR